MSVIILKMVQDRNKLTIYQSLFEARDHLTNSNKS